MPSVPNPKRDDITVNLGRMKSRLLNACKEEDMTMTEFVKDLVRKGLQAREKRIERNRKAELKLAATEPSVKARPAS